MTSSDAGAGNEVGGHNVIAIDAVGLHGKMFDESHADCYEMPDGGYC